MPRQQRRPDPRPQPIQDQPNTPARSRAFIASANCVAFFVDAGSHLQRCLIERATLLLYFGAREDPFDIALDSLRAFDRCATLIAIARDLARQGGGAMCEALLVSADAVFGHITRHARARIRRQAAPLALVAAG